MLGILQLLFQFSYKLKWQTIFYGNECHMVAHILVVGVANVTWTATSFCKNGKCHVTINILVADKISATRITRLVCKRLVVALTTLVQNVCKDYIDQTYASLMLVNNLMKKFEGTSLV